MNTLEAQYDFESLRAILESERGTPVSFREAVEIGTGLIELFTALGSDDMVQSAT